MTYLKKMGIDPNTVEGIAKIMNLKCGDIDDERERGSCPLNVSCPECKAARLLAEVPTVKRWETIRSDADVKRLYEEFKSDCVSSRCYKCKYNDTAEISACFRNFLLEEVAE